MNILQHNKKTTPSGQVDNPLTFLIGINILMLISLLLIKVIYYLSGSSSEAFYNSVLTWLALPASITQFIVRPWTIVTYMISHIGIWHTFSNMLWLSAFGYILQNLTGNKKIIPLYIYGGLAGAILYIIAFNILPPLRHISSNHTLLGASASIAAIAVATTTLAPNYKIFPLIGRGIPLWVLTLIFITIDTASILVNNTNIYLLHIGGALIGFIFAWQLKKGNDWGVWMHQFYNWINGLCNPQKVHTKKTIKEKHYYKATVKPFKKTARTTQQKVDELLDKINQQGYDSLTNEEKEILYKASKNL